MELSNLRGLAHWWQGGRGDVKEAQRRATEEGQQDDNNNTGNNITMALHIEVGRETKMPDQITS